MVADEVFCRGVLLILEKIFGWNPMIKLGCMQFWYLQSIFVVVLLWPIVRLLLSNKWTAIALIGILFAGWIGVYHYWYGTAMCAGNYLWLCLGALVGVRFGSLEVCRCRGNV